MNLSLCQGKNKIDKIDKNLKKRDFFYFVFRRLFEVLDDASLETPENDFWAAGDFELSASPKRFEPFERTEARGLADWLTAEWLRWIRGEGQTYKIQEIYFFKWYFPINVLWFLE